MLCGALKFFKWSAHKKSLGTTDIKVDIFYLWGEGLVVDPVLVAGLKIWTGRSRGTPCCVVINPFVDPAGSWMGSSHKI